jgi:hypothetical protein
LPIFIQITALRAPLWKSSINERIFFGVGQFLIIYAIAARPTHPMQTARRQLSK